MRRERRQSWRRRKRYIWQTGPRPKIDEDDFIVVVIGSGLSLAILLAIL
jgi:hypothetical protein